MKHILLLALCSSLFGGVQTKKAEPRSGKHPYDYDLYNKNQEAIFTNFEWLLWTLNESALDFAQTMQVSSFRSFEVGKVYKASFGLDSGVRISAGYFNAPKYWEVFAEYTWLNIRGSNHAYAPSNPDQFLTGPWDIASTPSTTQANSSLAFGMNTAYLLINRVFIPNPHLRLRTMAGIGTVWLNQDWHVRYYTIPVTSTVQNRWHFGGAGMRAGVYSDWYWGNNIYLSGGTSFGVFLGGYHNRSKEVVNLGPTTIVNINYKDTRAIMMTQFLLGFSWQQSFQKISRAEVFVGWELTPWLNLQETRMPTSSSQLEGAIQTVVNTSLLTLQGLTTRVSLNY